MAGAGEHDGFVAVRAGDLRELAEAMDGLMEAVRLSQEDVSEQVRAGGVPDFDGPYHLVWCRAMRAIIEVEPLIRLGRSLSPFRTAGGPDRHPTPHWRTPPMRGVLAGLPASSGGEYPGTPPRLGAPMGHPEDADRSRLPRREVMRLGLPSLDRTT